VLQWKEPPPLLSSESPLLLKSIGRSLASPFATYPNHLIAEIDKVLSLATWITYQASQGCSSVAEEAEGLHHALR